MPDLTRIPTYRRHKPTGQAVVTLNGRDIYLGLHGSAASRAAYDRAVAEWLAGGKQLPAAGLTVSECLLAYKRFTETHYRRADGSTSGEVDNIRFALRPLRKLYGRTAAAEFGPLKLIALRDHIIKLEWSRRHVNRQIGRVKAFFKWCVSREMIPASVFQALATVAGLAAGRSGAAERDPVRPAPQASIDAALQYMPSTVAAMVRLQLLTGARPGEICSMRMIDIDMKCGVWKYRPPQHKTRHHGHERIILIGPSAQALLKPFLSTETTACLFSPAAAMAERHAKAAAGRKTPPGQGNSPGTNRVRKPRRTAGGVYGVDSYRRAISYACDAAGVPRWHPHQLRHNAATSLREQFGIEAAKTILGHATLSATLLYAEDSIKQAEAIIGKVG